MPCTGAYIPPKSTRRECLQRVSKEKTLDMVGNKHPVLSRFPHQPIQLILFLQRDLLVVWYQSTLKFAYVGPYHNQSNAGQLTA